MKTRKLSALAIAACLLCCMIAPGALAEEKTTLTMWAALNPKSAVSVTSNADILSIKKTEEATGIHIEWTEPPVGEETTQFNLLIASQKLPDLIAWNWWNYPGGPEKAISEEILIDLAPYLDQMPNLKYYFDNNPELLKQCTTDEGHIYFFPRVNGETLSPEDKPQAYFMGPIYRQDILEALNLPVPETIDDWYNVLTAVKNAYPDMIPFSAAGTTTANTSLYAMASVFGVRPNYYMDNGKVNFGLLSPNFKTFVETMAKWYAEGLIDPDFLANQADNLKTLATSGKVFAFIGTQGANYVPYDTILSKGIPGAKLTLAPWPKGPDGVAYTAQSGVVNLVGNGFGIGITTECKNVEAAIKYLDYGYSEEGVMLNNFGVEGVSYEYDADGNIQWTADVAARIAESTVDDVIGAYAVCGITSWASAVHPYTFKLFRTYPGQYEAGELWGQASAALDMPPLTPTAEESSIVSTITNNVTTYRDEMIANIIMGRASMDNYDEVVENAKTMEIEKAVAIYNDALARYNAR